MNQKLQVKDLKLNILQVLFNWKGFVKLLNLEIRNKLYLKTKKLTMLWISLFSQKKIFFLL